MLKAQIIGGKETAARLQATTPKLIGALDRKVMELTIKLQGKVKATKLSGQVLNVITGRLRRSINTRFEGQGSGVSSGYVGTNVSYARPHEQGFKGVVNVKQHLRMQKVAWGKPIEPRQVTVAAHPMHMNIPGKSFLRSALDEMRPEVLASLQRAVHEGIAK